MWDAFAAAAWYGVTAVVICTAWTVARRAFPTEGTPQRMMHTLVLIWAWIAMVSFALGILGLLNAAALAAGVISAAAVTWFCLGRLKTRTLSFETTKSVDEGSAEGPPASTTAEGNGFSKAWYVFWIGAAAFTGALIGLRGLLQFPSDWDTLMYHRPMINLWLQTGSLFVPQCAVWYNPSSNELIGLWWAIAFSGDFWVGLINVPAVMLLALGAYEIGRRIGLPLLLRHATVIAIFGSSIVFEQVTNAMNDMAACALFLAGVAYGIRYVQGRNRWDLVLGAAALGLVAGVKYYALGYAAVGWVGFATMAWLRHGYRAAIAISLAVAAIMLLTGGYWYARNVAITGTPFFPVGFAASSASEPQLSQSAWHSSILGNGRVEVWPQYVQAVRMRGGNYQTLAVSALPASWLWLLGTSIAVQRRRSGPCPERCGLAVMLAGAWLVFGVTPFTVSADSEQLLYGPYLLVRFSQVPLGLSVIALSLVVSDVSRWISPSGNTRRIRSIVATFLPAALVALALATLFANAVTAVEDDWVLILLVAINAVLLIGLIRELASAAAGGLGRTKPILFFTILIGGMTAFVFSTAALSEWWHGNFAGHYDQRYRTQAFSELEGWDGPAPAVVAFQYRYYPFFGSRRQFRAARPRRVHSKEFLFTYLAWHRADAVVVIMSDPFPFNNYDGARGWLQEYPDVFHKMDAGGSLNLYSIDQRPFGHRLDELELNTNGRPSW